MTSLPVIFRKDLFKIGEIPVFQEEDSSEDSSESSEIVEISKPSLPSFYAGFSIAARGKDKPSDSAQSNWKKWAQYAGYGIVGGLVIYGVIRYCKSIEKIRIPSGYISMREPYIGTVNI